MAVRAQDTLTAMREMARYLSGMPGRKNLIWFSGSFPIQAGCYDFTEDMKSATDLLARAHVTINPVDGRAMDTRAPAYAVTVELCLVSASAGAFHDGHHRRADGRPRYL